MSATIFDSLTHNRIGNTETVEVKVTTDTLYPAQPIQEDDVLNIKPGVVKTWTSPHDPSNNPPDEIDIQLGLQTSKLYDYYSPNTQLAYESIVSNNSYTFNFANAIKLISYPFAYGYSVRTKVDGGIDLKGLIVGVPAKFSITWLNIKYTGSVTLINENECFFDWDNTGAVIIRS